MQLRRDDVKELMKVYPELQARIMRFAHVGVRSKRASRKPSGRGFQKSGTQSSFGSVADAQESANAAGAAAAAAATAAVNQHYSGKGAGDERHDLAKIEMQLTTTLSKNHDRLLQAQKEQHSAMHSKMDNLLAMLESKK